MTTGLSPKVCIDHWDRLKTEEQEQVLDSMEQRGNLFYMQGFLNRVWVTFRTKEGAEHETELLRANPLLDVYPQP